MAKTMTPSKANEAERFTAALSYVWILCLYPLLFKRDSEYIQHHAKQGTLLFALEILSPIFLFLAPIVIIICIIASAWGVKSALQGQYWTLPWVGGWLKKAGK